MERMKRWLSLALALVLVLSYVPANVFAEDAGDTPAPGEDTIVETTVSQQPQDQGIMPAADETVTVYLVAGAKWKEANAWFAAYYWGGSSGAGFVKMEADGMFYTAEIPAGHNNIIFLRKDPANTGLDWNGEWARIPDQKLDPAKPVFVRDAEWATTGTWIAYPASFDYYLAGYLNNANVGIEGAANKAANKFADGKVDVTLTADSYVCLGVQAGNTSLGNYMTQSYVSSGNTATMYANGIDKLFVPAGTYRFTLVTNADGSVTVSYGCPHSMTYHAAADATCGVPGNVAYYACSVCSKNFSDEAGITELTKVTIDSLDHEIEHVEAKEASCGDSGNVEHYYCDVCKGYFTDANGENATTKEAITVTKNHLNQQYLRKDATCTEDGYTFHYKCDYCGATFEDQEGTKPIDPALTAAGHSYDDNGFCINVADGVTCGGYESAVLVTAENCNEMGLSESYIGYYAISNAGQLYWFADKVDNENATYGAVNAVLTADIIVNSDTVTSDGTGLRVWNPIGRYVVSNYYLAFRGIFDGNGKTVAGLYLNSASTNGVGLISVIDENAVVKNVTVSNSYLAGGNGVGAIVGIADGAHNAETGGGTIIGCTNNGTVTGTAVGGIVGTSKAAISGCMNNGAVNGSGGSALVGGITGKNYFGEVVNCGNTGKIGGNGHTGGIVGELWGTVWNCWSTGEVSGTGNVGGIVGTTTPVPVAVENSYATQNPIGSIGSGSATVTDVERKTFEQFASGEVAYLLGGVWGQDLDNGKPVQAAPTFTGAVVYAITVNCDGDKTYSNTNTTESFAHNYDDNGFCVNSGTDGVCDAYEPAVLVTADNCAELGLDESYIGYYAITNAGQLYWFADKVDNENDTYKTAKVVLTKDITVNSGTITAESTDVRAWNPIGHAEANELDSGVGFDGTFDGNGKTISGLYFDHEDSGFAGIISWIGVNALVKDVTLSNSYLAGGVVGGIVGYADSQESPYGWADLRGTITGCTNNATIVGGTAGGIVGVNYAELSNCVNNGTIRGTGTPGIEDDRVKGATVGGIAGWNNLSGIVNCGNTGSVENGVYAGGIVGQNWSDVEKCWSTGAVSGNGFVGGIAGRNMMTADIEKCYATQEPVGDRDGSIYKVETKTVEQFASGEVTYLLGGVWGQDLDNGKPVQATPTFSGATVYRVPVDCLDNDGYSNTYRTELPPHTYDDNGFCIYSRDGVVCDAYEPAVPVTADNCAELGLDESYIGYYAITNAGQLYWFADKVDNENDTYKTAKVVLTKDIAVNPGIITAESTDARVWNPIGDSYRSFHGIFDGNGKTISGLYCAIDPDQYQWVDLGLFSIIGSGVVKRVTLANSYFMGKGRVGGIAALNHGTIIDCVNSATLGNHAVRSIGGIVAENYGTVERCGNTADITSTKNETGGIAGRNDTDGSGGPPMFMAEEGGIIRNCWNTGNISVDERNVGGIVGAVVVRSVVENCWSTGTATSQRSDDEAGGVAGGNSGKVSNCYSTQDPGCRGTDVEQKSIEQFVSGEVAYLLHTRMVTPEGQEPTRVWGQDLDNGKPVQTVPTFIGAEVFFGYTACTDTEPKYTNDPNASEIPIPHDWHYTATGPEIIAECGYGCGTDGGKVTLVFNGNPVYDGTEKTVDTTGSLAGVDTLPDVTYEGDRINVGTFTAYLPLEEDVTAELDVTITPKHITPIIEGVEDRYTHTGEAIKPTVTVKDGDKILVEGSDYDVTYGDNVNVGEGTVTVTMKGNYAGDGKETFNIIPNPDSPATGDSANVVLWSGIALISLAAAAALVLGKKRFTV